MAGVDDLGAVESGFFEGLDGFFFKADPFIDFLDGLAGVVEKSGAGFMAAQDGGDVGNLKAFVFARVDGEVGVAGGFEEEGTNEEGLEFSCFGFFHLFANSKEALWIHDFLGERVALEEVLEVFVVEGLVDFLCEFGADFGSVAVADGFKKHFFEADFFKDFAKDIEDATFEGFAFDL